MAKQHDTSRYTPFGLLLDQLLTQKQISYRQLAIQSGMSITSAMTIIRACRGESTPERTNLLKWCEVLEATPEQRRTLLHAFHYQDEVEETDLERDQRRITDLERELDQARRRIADLERQIEE